MLFSEKGGLSYIFPYPLKEGVYPIFSWKMGDLFYIWA